MDQGEEVNELSSHQRRVKDRLIAICIIHQALNHGSAGFEYVIIAEDMVPTLVGDVKANVAIIGRLQKIQD